VSVSPIVRCIVKCDREEDWLSPSASSMRPYYPETWLQPNSPNVDSAEPFSHGPRLMMCLSAQMVPCHSRALWLQSSADYESHCWHVPIDKVRRQTHEADDDAANCWTI